MRAASYDTLEPLPGYAVPGIEVRPLQIVREHIESIPSLFRAYLQLGARVCGPPAFDAAFGTTDFFSLLDLTQIASPYGRRFLAAER